jgi:hypothetical protein
MRGEIAQFAITSRIVREGMVKENGEESGKTQTIKLGMVELVFHADPTSTAVCAACRVISSA